jgi:hypothetical protein
MDRPIPRRACLKGVLSGLALATSGAASATVAVPVPAANASPSRLSGKALLETFARMRGRTDGKIVFGWLNATRSTVIDGDIVPLCGVVAGTLQRWERIAEDRYEVTDLEIAHYTDLATGELLDTLKMPQTGRSVQVPHYRFGPTKVRFAVALDEWEEFEPVRSAANAALFAPRSSVHLVRSIGPGWTVGSDLLLRADEYGRVYPDRAKPPTVFYREWMIWRASAAALANAGTPWVAADYSYSALSSWRPWMQMEGITGHTAENGFGSKAQRLSDCPAQFLELTRRLHPDVLDNPERALRGSAGK